FHVTGVQTCALPIFTQAGYRRRFLTRTFLLETATGAGALPARAGGGGGRGLVLAFGAGGGGGGGGGGGAARAGVRGAAAGGVGRAGAVAAGRGGRLGALRTTGRETGRSSLRRPGSASPMSTWPRKLAPSTMITRGALMSPTMRPSRVSSTLSVAVMLPTTTPLTIAFLTETLAFTIPEGSTMRVWESDSSPSTRPWTERSSSPVPLPLIRIDCPITVLPVSELPLAMCSALLHVHVDVALEGGTVRNQDPGGADVAHHAAVALELDLVAGGNVPGDAAGDLDVLRLDVCLH